MLKNCLKIGVLLVLLGVMPSLTTHAQAGRAFVANLISFEEVPAISTPGSGSFTMLIDFTDTSFTYNLKFSGLDAAVQQAHMHIAQKGVNGGIMIFFCTNLGNGPLGTPPCPASANLSGTVTSSDVVNSASAQGVSAGEFAEVLAAIRAGTAYVNVHSSAFPGGAIRGQIVPDPKTATIK